MPTLIQKSPAKINLFLHITGKRPDGYHNLQTVFRLINFYDTLTFTTTDKAIGDKLPVILANAEHVTENPADNLIVKASLALLDFATQQNILTDSQIAQLPIVDIHLEKHIPMGAGLGGGSSNCATTLMTLNDIWQLGLTKTQIRAIGAKLGADVPIFILEQDAIAEGIGEILTPIDLSPQQLLLLTPQAHINTAKLFANPHLVRDCQSFSIDYLKNNTQSFSNQLSAEFCNVFEPIVREISPEVNAAIDYLESLSLSTSTTPRMTGSGSCVFLPMTDVIDKNTLDTWQRQAPCPAYFVSTL